MNRVIPRYTGGGKRRTYLEVHAPNKKVIPRKARVGGWVRNSTVPGGVISPEKIISAGGKMRLKSIRIEKGLPREVIEVRSRERDEARRGGEDREEQMKITEQRRVDEMNRCRREQFERGIEKAQEQAIAKEKEKEGETEKPRKRRVKKEKKEKAEETDGEKPREEEITVIEETEAE